MAKYHLMNTLSTYSFGKIKRYKMIKIVICLLVIIVSGRLLSDVHISNNNTNDLINSDLVLETLQQAKHQEADLENKYQLTAIILHWKRLAGVKRSIRYYLSTKLFKEIIVWNNNPQVNLTHNQLLYRNAPSNSIRIINSNENLKDEAKYRACEQAETLACFYADDDWNVSHYIKSLIATFRSDPNVLHTATDLPTYYNNMLWTFMDSQIDLHTGFSWIGTGSIFLRKHARRHLYLLRTNLANNQKLLLLSDLFFSIWLNDIPSQMAVNLNPLPVSRRESNEAFSSVQEFAGLQHTSSVLAIRKLEYSLRLNQSNTNVTFPRHQNRRFPYYIKSSSLDDDFIFFSNVLPIDIEHVPFDIAIHADRGTYQNVPNGPNYTDFLRHNPLNVVDQDESTCWRSHRIARNGDFFAIDFLRIQTNITFTFTVGHSEKLQNSLNVRISFDGIWWMSYQSLKETFKSTSGGSLRRFIVDARHFPSEFQSFRYISFNSTRDFNEVFQVCEVQIIKGSPTTST